ncbi:MAG TPA: hypothetical protein VLT58_11615 [Polyangia bacterium]|nr:hypothetical protein [Polyangia bacterium]
MKPRDQSVPAAVQADRGARPVTREIPDDTDVDAIELETTHLVVPSPPRPPAPALDTAEIDWSRDRRVTVISTIPAQLAAEMLVSRSGDADDPDEDHLTPLWDPAAPQAEPIPVRTNEAEQHTRRVGDSDRQHLSPSSASGSSSGSGPTLGGGSGKTGEPDAIARRRQRAATLIDRARAALDDGDLTAAVDAAEGAMREADEAPSPGIVEVIEPARPLLTRVFAAYVGALSEVPVLAPRAAEIARDRLGERERALIGRIDGLRTLEELFDGSGLGSTDALRIAAQLIRTGAIRVI